MGRRSRHTPEELRELAIQSAHQIIAEEGLAGMSARAIARRIGYSPGTLYNLFDSLDELILQVEALLLDALDHRLSELPAEGTPEDQLRRIARAYLSFGRENAKAWNVIAQHEVAPESVPVWYTERLERVVDRIERALASNASPIRDNPESLKRSARVVWAGLYGIATLSTAEKMSRIARDPADILAEDLIETYLTGLFEKARSCSH